LLRAACCICLQDIVEVMAPTYTMGLHDVDTSTRWTTSDVMCYFVSGPATAAAVKPAASLSTCFVFAQPEL
jgi:hypothetical protein